MTRAESRLAEEARIRAEVRVAEWASEAARWERESERLEGCGEDSAYATYTARRARQTAAVIRAAYPDVASDAAEARE